LQISEAGNMNIVDNMYTLCKQKYLKVIGYVCIDMLLSYTILSRNMTTLPGNGIQEPGISSYKI